MRGEHLFPARCIRRVLAGHDCFWPVLVQKTQVSSVGPILSDLDYYTRGQGLILYARNAFDRDLGANLLYSSFVTVILLLPPASFA